VDRELRALAGAQRLELGDGNRLGLRLAEQVDPAGHDVFHPGFHELGLGVGHAVLVGEGRLHGFRIEACRVRGRGASGTVLNVEGFPLGGG
jgi:hypothetical protein